MFSDFLFRLRALFRRKAVEAELDDQLHAHLHNEIAKHEAAGLPAHEAARRARLALGGLEQIKEQCRDARGTRWLEDFAQDLRYTLRTLGKTPGFTTVALLTLALGVGANTALFTLLDGLVLRNLPVPHPEQLVRFGAHSPDDPFTALSLPMFQELSRGQNVFSSTFAWWGDAVLNVETDGVLSRGDIWGVTGNFYSAFGAVPELGRLIAPDDAQLDAATPAQVAVIGYGFWQRHYGSSRDVIGKTLKIEGRPFTIIGVARNGFSGISADIPLEVVVPITAEPLLSGETDVQKHLRRPQALWLEAAGRLNPGATLEQARAQLDSLWPAIQQATIPPADASTERAIFLALRLKIESGARGGSFLRPRFTKPLYILLGVAGTVLLLACVNLASLMLARAASRSREISVRVALGAGRGRLARQMLTESLTLSFAGALLGTLFAFWSSQALADFILGQIYIVPAELNLSPDWRIVAFTTFAALATGVLFGLAPAWRATREDSQVALQQRARTIGRGVGTLGKNLIVIQVALSLVLLTAAGLFSRSLGKLRAVDPGFLTSGMFQVGLFPKPDGYKNLAWVDYYHQLTDRVSHLPGVVSAGMIHTKLGNVLEWTEKTRITGTNAEELRADFEQAMPGFFATTEISLLQGRDFTWQDDDRAPRVAIVSKNFADKLFPAGDSLGRQFDVITMPKWQKLQIIGIVSNASLYDLRKAQPPTVYLPSAQYGSYMGWSEMLVRTKMPLATIAAPLRQAVESLGHEYVTSIKPVRADLDRSILQERLTAMLSAFFGVLALLLAAIGLYGLMAYTVTQRTSEIGIRLALGAPRSAVRWMVQRETMSLALVGALLGVPCAIAATQAIASMLFGLPPYDPATLATVVAILLAVAMMAGFLPSRRATRIDPLVALRHE